MLHFLSWLKGGRPEEAHVNTIAARIKEAQKRARLSQEALARRAGMSTNGVARIEQGGIADPHYSTLIRIADGLGMSVGELLEEEPVLSSGKAEAPAVRGTEKLPEGFDNVVTFAERVSEWARLYGDHAEARLGRAIEAGEFPAFEYQELLATARYTKGRFEEETAALPSYDK